MPVALVVSALSLIKQSPYKGISLYSLFIIIIIVKMSDNKKKCKVCKYEWNSRVDKPKSCPECKSRSWNK